MCLNLTKSSFTNIDYSLTLSSTNHFYRSLSTIQGDLHLNIRKKLCIEKKLRIDLIGQLIENKNSTKINQSFFTYSYPLVTSHDNGMARIIKNKQITLPFRIPIGINLPPTCEFKEFSIHYYLDIYHDGRLIPNVRKKIILAPPISPNTIPAPCQITGSNEITMICALEKSSYSGRAGTLIPLSIEIKNRKEKQIYSVIAQLIQIVSLNGIKHENEIFTTEFNHIKENTEENQIKTICELNLPPINLPPSYIPNENGQPDNVPSIVIIYNLRVTAQIKGATTPNLRLSVPIGID